MPPKKSSTRQVKTKEDHTAEKLKYSLMEGVNLSNKDEVTAAKKQADAKFRAHLKSLVEISKFLYRVNSAITAQGSGKQIKVGSGETVSLTDNRNILKQFHAKIMELAKYRKFANKRTRAPLPPGKVPARDEIKSGARLVYDNEGNVVMERVLDENGRAVLDENGQPVLAEKYMNNIPDFFADAQAQGYLVGPKGEQVNIDSLINAEGAPTTDSILDGLFAIYFANRPDLVDLEKRGYLKVRNDELMMKHFSNLLNTLVAPGPKDKFGNKTQGPLIDNFKIVFNKKLTSVLTTPTKDLDDATIAGFNATYGGAINREIASVKKVSKAWKDLKKTLPKPAAEKKPKAKKAQLAPQLL